MSLFRTLGIAFLLITCGALAGSGPASLGAQALSPAAGAVDPALYGSLRWRLIGPTQGGIAQAVVGDPSDPYVFYQGDGGGGVWKTDDAGQTWRNVSDGYFKTSTVGAIALAPSNPAIVYVGTGESCMRTTTSPGDGVYRSNDAGKTWTRIGLETTEHISRVVVHPTNPDVVYVAAMGDAYQPSPDRGIFRSRNGGKTWERVLHKSNEAGAIDLVMVTSAPNVLYAALWHARNYPWGNRNGGPDTGIYKSTDGGDTWSEITNNPGLPKGLKGRIGLDVSQSKPDRVWALMTAEGEGAGAWPKAGSGIEIPAGWKPCRDYVCAGNGLYRSDDGGATWQLVNNDLRFFSRPWYYTHVTADPRDPEKVYVLVDGQYVLTDGGKTTRRFRGSDTHDMWIDTANPRRMIVGVDQGASISLNGGATWSSLQNQPTGKFYRVSTDTRFPYRVYGGQQDGPTQSVPSRPDNSLPPTYSSGGGENAVVAVDPRNPDISYGGDHHWVSRHDRVTGQRRWVSPSPENNYGTAPKQMQYRFAWWFPVHISKHDPNTIYVGAQVLFRSRNEGQNWDVISPDLTLHDPKTMEDTLPSDPGEYLGITRENLTQWYSALVSFSESPVRRGVLWTGSDDGLVYVTRDDGKTWENATPREVQPHTHISTVEASPHDPAAAYIAVTRSLVGDDAPYLFKTNDYGRTWAKITTGIPAGDYTRTIREDPVRRGLLYAGTERSGVFVSFNDGDTWQPLTQNLPVVPVWDLAVKDNDLIAATHGRAYWVLDDLAVLRQIHAAPTVQTVRLFQPAQTVRFRAGGGGSDPAPWSGAMIRYFLRGTPQGEVTLSIADAQGREVARYSSLAGPEPPDALMPREGHRDVLPARAGSNLFIWDLRYPSIRKLPTALLRRGDPEGPLAVPGTYQVRLTANGETVSQPLEIVKDPRLSTSPEDFTALLTLASAIQETTNGLYRSVAEIRNVRQQVVAARHAVKPGSAGARRLVDAASGIEKKLWAIEDVLIQFRVETDPPAAQSLIAWPVKLNDKLTSLLGFIQTADARPTDQDQALFKELSARFDVQREALQKVLRADVATFNELARQQKVREVTLKFARPAS